MLFIYYHKNSYRNSKKILKSTDAIKCIPSSIVCMSQPRESFFLCSSEAIEGKWRKKELKFIRLFIVWAMCLDGIDDCRAYLDIENFSEMNFNLGHNYLIVRSPIPPKKLSRLIFSIFCCHAVRRRRGKKIRWKNKFSVG